MKHETCESRKLNSSFMDMQIAVIGLKAHILNVPENSVDEFMNTGKEKKRKESSYHFKIDP